MKEITNELEKTKKAFSLFSRLRKKSNLDSQVWDDFEEIMLIGSGKGVASVKTINQIKWKRKKLEKFLLQDQNPQSYLL